MENSNTNDYNDEIYNRNVTDRLLTMYDNMLESSVHSYIQLNTNIRTVESGLREILSHQRNVNYNNRSRNFSNNEYRNPRHPLPESLLREMSNYNNRPLNSSYRSYTRNDLNNNSRLPLRQQRSRPSAAQPSRRHMVPNLDAESNDLLRAFFPNTFTNTFTNEQLTPVIVRPTAEEIERISEIIPFSLANSLNNRMCPITQRDFIESDVIIRLRGCGHCFLQQPVNSWFSRSVLCPVCRYDVRNYTSINDLSNNEQVIVEDEIDEDVIDEDVIDEDVTDEESIYNSNDLISIMSSQLTQAITNQFTTGMDLSFNNLDNRGLNLEYTIETPTGGFTISSASSSSIGEMLRNFNQPPNRQQ